MTTSANEIYALHLSAQLGEDGAFTEQAVFDPSDSAEIIYGIFDDSPIRENKDAGNVYSKNKKPRFIVSGIITFDLYTNKELYLTDRAETHTIRSITPDKTGAQVLWLS